MVTYILIKLESNSIFCPKVKLKVEHQNSKTCSACLSVIYTTVRTINDEVVQPFQSLYMYVQIIWRMLCFLQVSDGAWCP